MLVEMGVYLGLQSSWLKVIANLLVNIAAGVVLLMFTVRSVPVLTLDIIFVMVCVLMAVRIEDILEDL